MTEQAQTPDNNDPEKEENLAERSARLEAEAEAIAKGQMAREEEAEHDHLSPEPLPEENPEETAAAENDPQIINAELEKAREQTARALAEAENTRKRARKEREDASKFAVASFAKDMLEVSDNLRRALEAVTEELVNSDPLIKNLMDGIEATERTMLKNFEKHGIEKLEPLDEPFNPNFHEVMFEAPVPGKVAGTIMQVAEPGYILNGRILRPARVGVVKDDGSTPAEPPQGGHIDTEA